MTLILSFRNIRTQLFADVLQNSVVTDFAKFNGIHLLLSLFSNTGVFLRILQKF